ncbi:MAG: flagellar brake protein [Oscillospiraceae bacterium]|nr:flagellar brake protein [Oscillospiraceae bacterium]
MANFSKPNNKRDRKASESILTHQKNLSEIELPTGTPLAVIVKLKAEEDKTIILRSVFESVIDDENFLISAPMRGTLLYPLAFDDEVKIEFMEKGSGAYYETKAFAGERVAKDKLDFLEMRFGGYFTRFQRRSDFRVDVNIETSFEVQIKNSEEYVAHDCLINNLSAGGVAMLTGERPEIGDMIQLLMPSEIFGLDKKLTAQINWVRRNNDPDIPYPYYIGAMFHFTNSVDKDDLIKYALKQQREQRRRELFYDKGHPRNN